MPLWMRPGAKVAYAADDLSQADTHYGWLCQGEEGV